MGKWNRRYIPSRKRYRHYDYEDPIPTFDDNSDVSDGHNHKAPQWEIDYCKSVRVPWRKVLASKKYSYCYPNVREWNDSSGEEAFNNAKQRYLSMTNGLQCEIPLPDPNIYIDEVDWNAPTDPKLVADLDLLYYDPNHENHRKLASVEDIGIDRSGGDNPWEFNHTRGDGVLVDGWGCRVDSENMKKHSLGEQNWDQHVNSWNNGAWESGNNSWDRRVDSQIMRREGSWEQNRDRPVDSWNNCALETGNRDQRVDSQHTKKGSSWEQNWDRPVDSRNNRPWGSGNNSWDRRVDSQNTKNGNAWERNYDQPVNSWNNSARGRGNNSRDQRVDSQHMKKGSSWEQDRDRTVDSWNRVITQKTKNSSSWEQNRDQPINSGWRSGNNSRDQGVDSRKQTNWGQNCDQVADSWNANHRFGNSCANNPRDKVPVERRWRQRESDSQNFNAQDQDSGSKNYRNSRENKRWADVNDRGWRGRDGESQARRWNRGGRFQSDNNGERRGF